MKNEVETWLAKVSAKERALIDRLRAIVRAAEPALVESLKWNAPSFADGGRDRVTLGVERKGGVRVVLHRGAAVQDAKGFVFEDADKVAKWPSPDRGVATFADLAAIDAKAEPLEALVRRWVEANRSSGTAR